ncbi:upstream activation factor complex subunit Acr1 [Schizosaccharomyces cryophilus OY26]|uniref:Upstream activation factor complex subunit Acr1 n=1 Tax=Schizosaccharomyces cryophilus (strain OY26 / ATCC MYA-4695 / CBS 11777 / NBRC 106824 / NRRL Y48691) TaxID=653667 RepID=S9VRV0_SCHCR|nr:upstream activation factor complex subunit Acr1 [Schizosaccharomyces cryophilus OY26]EPY50663.1 upstream activation factor complex subunit Acr1 [Schizosaccharomyces cryophilus OY26]
MRDSETPYLEEREEYEESPTEREAEVPEKRTLLTSEIGAYKEIISNLKQETRNDLATQLFFVHETLKNRGHSRNGNDGHEEEKDTKTPSRYWTAWPTKESTFLESEFLTTGASRFRQETAALAVRIASHKLQQMNKNPSSEEYPNAMTLRRLTTVLQRKLECLLDAIDSFRQQQRSRLMQERLSYMDWQVVYGLAKLTRGAFSSTEQDASALEKATEQCRRLFGADLSQLRYATEMKSDPSMQSEFLQSEDETLVHRMLDTIDEQIRPQEGHQQQDSLNEF